VRGLASLCAAGAPGAGTQRSFPGSARMGDAEGKHMSQPVIFVIATAVRLAHEYLAAEHPVEPLVAVRT
jgi:hypothetical protein